jgi:hypothetical protein
MSKQLKLAATASGRDPMAQQGAPPHRTAQLFVDDRKSRRRGRLFARLRRLVMNGSI